MKFAHNMKLTRGSRPPRPHPSEGVVVQETRLLQGKVLTQVITFTDRVETRTWRKMHDTFFRTQTNTTQQEA